MNVRREKEKEHVHAFCLQFDRSKGSRGIVVKSMLKENLTSNIRWCYLTENRGLPNFFR